MKNYYELDNIIKNITTFQYKFFLNKANVVGIGLGHRIKNGFYTSEKCIKVFVRKKLPQYKLRFNDLIPRKYKGILTDVNEVGDFRFQMLNKKVRPLIGGYSIGANVLEHFVNTGSIGCLVTDNTTNYLLSSGHVLSDFNTLSPGSSIVQPSLFDGGSPLDEVGKLSKYTSIKSESMFKKPVNLMDAAIVALDSGVESYSDIAFIGKPRGIDNVNLNEFVFKVGRTTEETSGKVTDISVTCEISLNTAGKMKKYLFKNQIITTSMSQEGDSGAVLVNVNKKIAGLLVGGSASSSIFSNITDVLNTLNVTIVL